MSDNNQQKFYKTTISITVLSEQPFCPDTLGEVPYSITDGNCSRVWEITNQFEITRDECAKLLRAQGSSPEFFMLEDNPEPKEEYTSNLVLYDVCNDYSLEEATILPDPGDYNVKIQSNIRCWFDKKYGELHYCEAPPGMNGKSLSTVQAFANTQALDPFTAVAPYEYYKTAPIIMAIKFGDNDFYRTFMALGEAIANRDISVYNPFTKDNIDTVKIIIGELVYGFYRLAQNSFEYNLKVPNYDQHMRSYLRSKTDCIYFGDEATALAMEWQNNEVLYINTMLPSDQRVQIV